MANEDEEMPLTLPDTQNVDEMLLTQSQEVTAPRLVIWGRLFPCMPRLKQLVMSKDCYTLGRHAECDVHLTTTELNPKQVSVVSKIHLRILREKLNRNDEDKVVYLEDLSSNGTFVNRTLVGKGRKVILQNNDVISLAQPSLEVYTYMSSSNPESERLPPELRSRYVVSRTLGSGACGEVKLIIGIFNSKKFALKTISKKNFTKTNGVAQGLDAERIKTEVNILKALRHPCIIKMEEIVDTPTRMFIVLEMMEGGELFDRITESEGLQESVAKLIFYQIVLAVHYLHKQGITHRDLKPENILLASHDQYPLVKVTDFGLSKFVDDETMMRTFCGTPMYVAPEMVITNGRGSYTKQVDVWSLGVILYVSIAGRTPFSCQNKTIPLRDQIVKGMYRCSPSLFGNVSSHATDLIKRMMTTDPTKRISIRQVLLHSWLQDRRMKDMVQMLISSYEENRAPPGQENTDAAQHVFDAPVAPLLKRLRRE